MKTTYLSPSHVELIEALEGRVALRLASRLSQGTDQLPHDISERLRFAREQAVSRAKMTRHQLAPTPLIQSNGTAVLGGPSSVWWRVASVLPLVVLVAGLVLIQQYHDVQQISAAAEIDAALLSDELPPAAYRDPGFTEFLQAQEAP
ncbi:DUF3619 family protein [Ideonella sp. A 288]|uniref:DUF3619 family protein n=1 Tax=Ideonella sp. A 288 TaxID=1962181 RepID=UPI001F3AB96D|nr:DUF3619 family protein [Ideonella sp. A 288]